LFLRFYSSYLLSIQLRRAGVPPPPLFRNAPHAAKNHFAHRSKFAVCTRLLD
jgi:hypothetical protein